MTDPTPIPEQPTAPRTRRTPDTCSKCGAPGYRIVDDRGDGSVRFERAEAAASVPAPGQEEAVREALFAAAEHINHSGKGSADYRAGWRDALEAVARDPALATPPPVPAAPPEEEWDYYRLPTPPEQLREAEILGRMRQAARVAACPNHDNAGPVDEPSGLPTCSKCGAILTAEAESRIRNAVLDEIEQRLDAQTEPDIYDGDDENTRVMIGRVTYKRIIEDMRHEV